MIDNLCLFAVLARNMSTSFLVGLVSICFFHVDNFTELAWVFYGLITGCSCPLRGK